ncbi:jg5983 [Pararge aegeria aegeria]|uniref:Jg5983 protein n=1 Tax=Pararge aegeria aegeria TaxID=348720 RepID=A0A8S4S452_9NEOP|nr:jg5983 [Pararge aegeria aegeria]
MFTLWLANGSTSLLVVLGDIKKTLSVIQPGDFKRDGDSFICSHCDKAYDKKTSLRFHIRTHHYSAYECPHCELKFKRITPFTVHKLKAHDVDDRVNCNACKGKFNSQLTLKKHIRVFHMLGTKYYCKLCDYESYDREGLYKHKFKHKTVKDYHCRFCKKSFIRRTNLNLHEKIHTDERSKVCKMCGQAFVQKASLNYHMNKYHPEVDF